MNIQEDQTFEECKRQIKNLIAEEKRTEAKLKEIQKAKMECIRILLDDDYNKKIVAKIN